MNFVNLADVVKKTTRTKEIDARLKGISFDNPKWGVFQGVEIKREPNESKASLSGKLRRINNQLQLDAKELEQPTCRLFIIVSDKNKDYVTRAEDIPTKETLYKKKEPS
jgi:hypothetical protein